VDVGHCRYGDFAAGKSSWLSPVPPVGQVQVHDAVLLLERRRPPRNERVRTPQMRGWRLLVAVLISSV